MEQTRPDGSNFNIHTVINYEGPHTNFNEAIDNPYLERIINVWGTAPTLNPPLTGQWTGNYVQDVATEQMVPELDPTKKDIQISDFGPPFVGEVNFSGPAGIENINIEIIGARHNDFSYDATVWNDNPYPPEAEAQEINRKTNIFMRRLYKAALDDQTIPNSLNMFFEQLREAGTATHENGIWKIDAKKLPY